MILTLVTYPPELLTLALLSVPLSGVLTHRGRINQNTILVAEVLLFSIYLSIIYKALFFHCHF